MEKYMCYFSGTTTTTTKQTRYTLPLPEKKKKKKSIIFLFLAEFTYKMRDEDVMCRGEKVSMRYIPKGLLD